MSSLISPADPPGFETIDIILNDSRIRERVCELGAAITEAYKGRRLVMIAVLRGALPFAADLMRAIDIPMEFDVILASSYSGGDSAGDVKLHVEPRINIDDAHVLVVDDILDTGRTLYMIRKCLLPLKPATLSFCVLLDKPSRRQVIVNADYVGFEIPDLFVVGYGLDFNERHRNLPHIGILKS